MAARWSCREFLPDPLPDDVLRDVMVTAQRTASWCNTQPWQVHLLSGEAVTWLGDALVEHVVNHPTPEEQTPDLDLPAAYVGVYKERQRGAGYALYESLGIERSDFGRRAEQMLRNFSFFGAPHVAIVTTDRTQGTYGVLDCGGYVANLMNAALAHGVASIAQGAIGMQAGPVRELLGLPEDRLVVCGVALGRPAEHPVNDFRTTRAELEDVVTLVDAPPAATAQTARERAGA
ncbi:MAG: nitroreductase [Nocardioides sp.]|nr:nitroreductase [Nocardioides sp.]